MAAIGGEDQVLLEVSVRLAQKRDNPGVIGECVDERIAVGQIELGRLDEQTVQVGRIDGPNAADATASGQDADVLAVSDDIDAAEAQRLFHKLGQGQRENAVAQGSRLENDGPLCLLGHLCTLFHEQTQNVITRLHHYGFRLYLILGSAASSDRLCQANGLVFEVQPSARCAGALWRHDRWRGTPLPPPGRSPRVCRI